MLSRLMLLASLSAVSAAGMVLSAANPVNRQTSAGCGTGCLVCRDDCPCGCAEGCLCCTGGDCLCDECLCVCCAKK